MDWYDLITPTNPLAAIFFGIMFSMIIAALAWIETKEKKTTILSLLVGCVVVVVLVGILYLVGFY